MLAINSAAGSFRHCFTTSRAFFALRQGAVALSSAAIAFLMAESDMVPKRDNHQRQRIHPGPKPSVAVPWNQLWRRRITCCSWRKKSAKYWQGLPCARDECLKQQILNCVRGRQWEQTETVLWHCCIRSTYAEQWRHGLRPTAEHLLPPSIRDAHFAWVWTSACRQFLKVIFERVELLLSVTEVNTAWYSLALKIRTEARLEADSRVVVWRFARGVARRIPYTPAGRGRTQSGEGHGGGRWANGSGWKELWSELKTHGGLIVDGGGDWHRSKWISTVRQDVTVAHGSERIKY